MPYFDSETWSAIQTRQKRETELTTFKYPCCTTSPETFEIYLPLTLDEYHSPNLAKDILETRNQSQVLVWTQTRRSADEQNAAMEEVTKARILDTTRLLTVNQAWFWLIKDTFIAVQPEDPSDLMGGRRYGEDTLGKSMTIAYTPSS